MCSLQGVSHAQWFFSGSLRYSRLIELRWADRAEEHNTKEEAGNKTPARLR